MKFFHLADLHFGKIIHGYSLIEMGDQPFWIDQLIEKAKQIKPDAILIAGDVYDRAIPSKEAVNLFDDFLTGLAKLKIPVLMVSGNHDSGTRLAFGDRLLCHQGIYIAGEVKKEISCVTLEDEYGPVNFWLLPYLFPAVVNTILDREDIKDYDLALRALLEEQKIDFEQRNVMVAHQFVVAGSDKPTMGGSETTVGGIGQIDASVFGKFDYTALGHIHNAQCMGNEKIRYAGSPMSYHFSEKDQKKGLTIVELTEKGKLNVTVEELPVLHKMQEVSGTMEEILNTKVEKNHYIRAVIRQELLPPQAVETLRNYFKGQDCILMEVVRELSGKNKGKEICDRKDVGSYSLEELFTEFYKYQHDGNLPDSSLEQLISFAAEQVRNSDGDETEKEKKQAAEQLIEFAASCSCEEETT